MEKFLGNSNQSNPHLRLSQKQPTKLAKKKPIKIKYISSPMMVRANNATEFRAIVQELTGRNSNIGDSLYDDVQCDDEFQVSHTTLISELDHDHDDHDHQPRWLPFDADHHQQGSGTLVQDDVDEKFLNQANISMLAQIDELFWRSEVSENFNGFQSSCVFVGQI